MSLEAIVQQPLAFDGSGARIGAGAHCLESFLATLSRRLLCASADRLDDLIEEVLESAALTFAVDRAGVVRLADAGLSLDLTHAYAAPGIPAWHTSDLAPFTWYARQIRRGEAVVLSRLPDDLPAEAATEAKPGTSLGVKS